MRVAVGSDHRGFRLKERLLTYLCAHGHKVMDLGTDSEESTNYPDFAFRVAEAVIKHQAQRGILICGTGIGMSIAANRVPGIRAALCCDMSMARLSRLHNNANVLCLGGDMVTEPMAKRIVSVWLRTGFLRGRHRRRLEMIDKKGV
ncbi:ribose 5-phosphate isomerase B [candidate division WOR-3 bacterium JGI_Cruoil_03_51_56]|uniref:Ribose 5-phosphate isomerase B n=1 Tax=candidate division WOR-3 bacterium JGI_Cruoil_03_51_56 TaxID=1973747 RepID=A0A235BYY2_UNCW3|nr:MAG: ribose 5-phosphate isomerase B [candidate division WOR-3 bacterium JGI_Cruoil_03_51_56]